MDRLKKAGLVKDYALAGAMAMAAWGYLRATADIDLLIIAEITDIPAIEKKLFGKAFFVEGAKMIGLRFFVKRTPVDLFFAHTKSDVEAVNNSKRVKLSGVSTKVIPLDFLIKMKKRSKRGKDKIDSKELMKL